MSGHRRGWARVAPGEEDQIARLAAFRAAHPEVIIGDGGFGTRQARIAEPDGETTITRYTLRELLDKLSVIFPDLPDRAASPPRRRALNGRTGTAGVGQRGFPPQRNPLPASAPAGLVRP